MKTQADLINQLQAIFKPESTLQEVLSHVTGTRVTIEMIGNWRRDGIAWRFRPAIAKLATEYGLDMPDEFLYRDVK